MNIFETDKKKIPHYWIGGLFVIGIVIFGLWFFQSIIVDEFDHVRFLQLMAPGLPLAFMTAFLGGSISLFIYSRKAGGLNIAILITYVGVIYFLGASPNTSEHSASIHFSYLADMFLNGRVALDVEPAASYDWTFYNDRWSISFPPLPAILMMPFVFVFGLEFNDVLFTLGFGLVNIILFYYLIPNTFNLILDKKYQLSENLRITATLVFALGTPHWWVSSFGRVYFIAHIIATTFLLLSLWELSNKQRPLYVSLYLSLAALTRTPILFAFPFFFLILFWKTKKEHSWRLLTGLIPPLIVAVLMGYYNFLRYGNVLELGYKFMNSGLLEKRGVGIYGLFHPHFFSENFLNTFLKSPEFDAGFPYLLMDGWGLSIFVSTPFLLLLVFIKWRDKISLTLLGSAIAVNLPSLFYYNTGYRQSSNRFLLDYLPMLLIVVLIALEGENSRLGKILAYLSIIMGFVALINFYVG